MSQIIDNQRQAYTESFIKHGPTPQGTYQNNTDTQYFRFERLIKNIQPFLPQSTIHDVGSGLCDLHKYLNSLNIEHHYSGTEIVQEMNDYSLREFPGIKLYNRDLLTVDNNETYDFIVLSGTMNLLNDQNPKDWEAYCYRLIQKMYNQANKAISFNCLTSYKTFTDPTLFYFNPQEVFDFCMKNLSRFVTIDHGYPLYEFTCTVFKPDFLAQQYNKPAFHKYF